MMILMIIIVLLLLSYTYMLVPCTREMNRQRSEWVGAPDVPPEVDLS